MPNENKTMPVHVAMIMDGNGRWAKERGKIRLFGHKAGMEALREIVKHSSEIGVKYLTVYAFSTENWKRPIEEVSGIFKLLTEYVATELDDLNKNGVQVRLIGDWSLLPEESRQSAQKLIDSTAENSGLVFSIALNYGGRAEIVRAAKMIAEKAASGEISPASVDEGLFSGMLYTADMPDPDLIIRTGGEYRLSNFLTWQSAYSELVVTDVYWPDFTPEDYDKAIERYLKRDRRFGGIKA